MAPVPAAVELGGRRFDLGTHRKPSIAAVALDLARLLGAAHLADCPEPALAVLDDEALHELRQRADWQELLQAPGGLDAAVARLVGEALPEQARSACLGSPLLLTCRRVWASASACRLLLLLPARCPLTCQPCPPALPASAVL